MTPSDVVQESRRGTLNIVGERSMDLNFAQSESPSAKQSLLFARTDAQ